MAVIFHGGLSGTRWCARACRFHAENKIAGERLKIDSSATVSDPLNFTHPFRSWSPPRRPSLKTPASLRDIRWTQWVDETRGLTASVDPCILLTPIAPAWVPQPNDCLCSDVHYCFRSAPCPPAVKENGNAMTRKVGGRSGDYSGKVQANAPARKHSICSDRRCYTRGSALSKNTGTIVLQLEP